MTRVLLVAIDRVGTRMAGPAIRYWELANVLATQCDVELAVPGATDLEPDGFRVREVDLDDSAALARLAAEFDVVVAERLPVPAMRRLARARVRTIYDLYAPRLLENVALEARSKPDARSDFYRMTKLVQDVALSSGDAFVCASERQRDLWLGALMAAGRVDRAAYDRDPSLRDLIDVVPFGIPAELPPRGAAVLRGVVDGIPADAELVIWPGGIWEWFDPLTVIRAVAELASERPRLRLYFLGLQHPNPEIERMAMTDRAVELARELDVLDRVVFFNYGWVPYADRGRYLGEADVGISAHFDDVESRYAFRTRLLDCFWAGLPVVATKGDELSDLVEAERLGRTVPVADVAAWRAALAWTLDDVNAVTARRNIEAVRERFTWDRAAAPLERLIRADSGAEGGRRVASWAVASYLLTRSRMSIEYRGPAGFATHAGARIAERFRRIIG